LNQPNTSPLSRLGYVNNIFNGEVWRKAALFHSKDLAEPLANGSEARLLTRASVMGSDCYSTQSV
jgi:hypothetical protein